MRNRTGADEATSVKWAVRTGALLSGVALAASLGGISQAQAATPRSSAGVQSIDYISGKDVTVGSCKGWMNRRSTDGYVQGLVQSWNGADCVMWLERKVIGSYDYKSVSDGYEVINTSASTGFHWNGANAGSRVCVHNYSTGAGACGDTAW
ncbi:hypothetical protein [Streptomyces sp. AK04-3B]|uniref:hypothetical protein n=1 Tax=unclassified Streptomyces TaxID=2593676 RepID=UPI0029A9564D|nr:hypothetical protein [Streptomyces sp. AK04-3B]MDX3804294.1 hypothetical protein [Streptomyces sp. AK04-3B]